MVFTHEENLFNLKAVLYCLLQHAMFHDSRFYCFCLARYLQRRWLKLKRNWTMWQLLCVLNPNQNHLLRMPTVSNS